MEKLFRTTLDIDTNDKEFIERAIMKIRLLCKSNKVLVFRDSSFKGVHVILACNKKCEICQFVYDDFRRFAYDRNRPYYARNILFTEEIYP